MRYSPVNIFAENALLHLGITSLTLGDPRWGGSTKQKMYAPLELFIMRFSPANIFAGNALLHLGITSLPLGDPRWGALQSKKT